MISGRGSNLATVLELQESLEPVLVLSSSKKALGLRKARLQGVTCLTISDRNWAEQAHRLLNEWQIEQVLLLGFMKIVPDFFVKAWEGKLFNLHPSLLPHYPGLKSIERAFNDRAKLGVSWHEVSCEVDGGRLIEQRAAMTESGFSTLEEAEFQVHLIEQSLLRDLIVQSFWCWPSERKRWTSITIS